MPLPVIAMIWESCTLFCRLLCEFPLLCSSHHHGLTSSSRYDLRRATAITYYLSVVPIPPYIAHNFCIYDDDSLWHLSSYFFRPICPSHACKESAYRGYASGLQSGTSNATNWAPSNAPWDGPCVSQQAGRESLCLLHENWNLQLRRGMQVRSSNLGSSERCA